VNKKANLIFIKFPSRGNFSQYKFKTAIKQGDFRGLRVHHKLISQDKCLATAGLNYYIARVAA
jgi:hypothetical protein